MIAFKCEVASDEICDSIVLIVLRGASGQPVNVLNIPGQRKFTCIYMHLGIQSYWERFYTPQNYAGPDQRHVCRKGFARK